MESSASVKSSQAAAQPDKQVVSANGASSLVLRWQGQDIAVPASDEMLFGIGAATENELQLLGQFVSRFHAVLRWHRNGFDLIDRSTNGVFVQLEDAQVRFVHRRSFRLWGSGYVSFGEPLNESNFLSFRNA